MDEEQAPGGSPIPSRTELLLWKAVGKRVAAGGTPVGIKMAVGTAIRTRAETSAERSRLTSSRLLMGVETGSQTVAWGFPDSHVENQD
jgi:hypothetical protein